MAKIESLGHKINVVLPIDDMGYVPGSYEYEKQTGVYYQNEAVIYTSLKDWGRLTYTISRVWGIAVQIQDFLTDIHGDILCVSECEVERLLSRLPLHMHWYHRLSTEIQEVLTESGLFDDSVNDLFLRITNRPMDITEALLDF